MIRLSKSHPSGHTLSWSKVCVWIIVLFSFSYLIKFDLSCGYQHFFMCVTLPILPHYFVFVPHLLHIIFKHFVFVSVLCLSGLGGCHILLLLYHLAWEYLSLSFFPPSLSNTFESSLTQRHYNNYNLMSD